MINLFSIAQKPNAGLGFLFFNGFSGASRAQKQSDMSKPPYPRMQCYVCKRPMTKAAALLGGYPVGPVCAASQGLLPFGRGSAAPRAKAPEAGAVVVRDTKTADMFGGV